MSESEKAVSASSKKGMRSFVLTLVLLLLVLAAWWYFTGPGKEFLPDLLSPGEESAPDRHDPLVDAFVSQPSTDAAQRLAKLETLAVSLDGSRRTLEAELSTLEEFARAEDLQASVTRLRGEIRGVRESFPEAAELEGSQITLAWHLVQLAEIEYRLFGDAEAVSSILTRVQNLLRDNPDAIAVLVDIGTLAHEIEESSSLSLLAVEEELRDIEALSLGVPLAASEFRAEAPDASGFFERLGSGLRSLVRIERRVAETAESQVTRLQLLFRCQRMHLAALRRDGGAFHRERLSAIDWLDKYADHESEEAIELRDRLEGLRTQGFERATLDFSEPLADLAELAGRG